MLDWYTFNVFTLFVMCGLMVLCLVALFITVQERKQMKREKEEWLKRRRLGRKI